MPFLSHYGSVPDVSQRLSIPSLVFCILTSLTVAARLNIRLRQNILQPDDWIILLASLCAATLGMLMLLCCAAGFGKHIAILDRPTIVKTLRYFYLSQIFYKLSISLTKLSILCFYRRLFHIHKRFRLICDALTAIVLAWIVAAFFATVFQCTPITFAYDRAASQGKGSCINLQASWYANAVFNISSDLIITLLPMPVIHSLQINMREKAMLCGLFALGFLVCGTSILRATTIDLAGSQADRTWHSVDSSMWSVYEANLAIIGACMPVLKKPLTRILRLSTKGSSNHSSSANGYTATVTTNASPKSTNRFSLSRSDSKRGASSSEDDILRDHDMQLYSITKTREVHMSSRAARIEQVDCFA